MHRSIRPLRHALIAAVALPLLVATPGLNRLGHMTMSAEAAGLPASCAAIAAAHPTAKDGTYLIFVGYVPVRVYCAMMSTAPATYLTLPHTGSLSNYSLDTVNSPPVETWFSKVGLVAHGEYSASAGATCQAQICVNERDFTYSQSSTSSGLSQMSYADAYGCGGPDGSANVDLRGTSLRVAPNAFVSVSFMPTVLSVAYSSNNQVVNLTANGFCGELRPASSPLLPLQTILGVLN